MEDILASIRRIISDEDRSHDDEGSQRDSTNFEHPRPEALRSAPAGYTQPSAEPEEDVFDLTDELIFAEAPPSGPAPAPHRPVSAESLEAALKPRFGAEAAERSANIEQALEPQQNDAAHSQPPLEVAFNVAPSKAPRGEASPSIFQQSRPVWSRRELPGSGGAFAPAQRSPARSREGVKAQPASEARPAIGSPPDSWGGDIQMPIPEQGPVPLLGQEDLGNWPSQGYQDESQTALKDAEMSEPKKDAAKELASVAQSLAKSAIVQLDDGELAEARHVDFARLDETNVNDVSEKFADAMEMTPAIGGRQAEPFVHRSVLDDVLGRKLGGENSFFGQASASVAAEAPAKTALKSRGTPSPQPSFLNDGGDQDDAPPPMPDFQHQAIVEPLRKEPPVRTSAAAPVSQAQFVGAAATQLPAGAGRTLEESVREMLRPLLMQWLNENMPRILESAIREEIATRGLLPRGPGND